MVQLLLEIYHQARGPYEHNYSQVHLRDLVDRKLGLFCCCYGCLTTPEVLSSANAHKYLRNSCRHKTLTVKLLLYVSHQTPGPVERHLHKAHRRDPVGIGSCPSDCCSKCPIRPEVLSSASTNALCLCMHTAVSLSEITIIAAAPASIHLSNSKKYNMFHSDVPHRFMRPEDGRSSSPVHHNSKNKVKDAVKGIKVSRTGQNNQKKNIQASEKNKAIQTSKKNQSIHTSEKNHFASIHLSSTVERIQPVRQCQIAAIACKILSRICIISTGEKNLDEKKQCRLIRQRNISASARNCFSAKNDCEANLGKADPSGSIRSHML